MTRDPKGEAEKRPNPTQSRQLLYGFVGAALYGLFSWVTNHFPMPAAGDVTFRPAVALLIFLGAAYGPWTGLLAGSIGNTLGDMLTGWELSWNWSVGNGLMGMIPGLIMSAINDFRARADIMKAIGWGTLGIIVGMLFASLTEIAVEGIDLYTALVGYFVPAFLGNFIVTFILVPVLMIGFAAMRERRVD